MDLWAVFQRVGIAIGLGLLVGLQRERAESKLAGIRTFPLIAALGAMSAAGRAGRVLLTEVRRADFTVFLVDDRALFAVFLTVRRGVLLDRPAALADCLLMVSI